MYCITVPQQRPVFHAFSFSWNKSDEIKSRIRTTHACLFISGFSYILSECIWTCLTDLRGKDGLMTAVIAGQLASDFCSHGH